MYSPRSLFDHRKKKQFSSWPGIAVRRTASLPLAYARPSTPFLLVRSSDVDAGTRPRMTNSFIELSPVSSAAFCVRLRHCYGYSRYVWPVVQLASGASFVRGDAGWQDRPDAFQLAFSRKHMLAKALASFPTASLCDRD